jgi:hypothetical protein
VSIIRHHYVILKNTQTFVCIINKKLIYENMYNSISMTFKLVFDLREQQPWMRRPQPMMDCACEFSFDAADESLTGIAMCQIAAAEYEPSTSALDAVDGSRPAASYGRILGVRTVSLMSPLG